MKALVLEGKKTIHIKELPDPLPTTGEAIVQVAACAVCGSDRNRYLKGHHTLPMVLGHEFSGRVIAVGLGVDPDWQGRRVAVAPLVPCHRCAMCQSGRYAACQEYRFIGSSRQGGMAEKVAVPVRNLIPIEDSVSFTDAALVEPVTVGIHALSLGGFHPGKSVAVLGAGSIGLLLIHWLHHQRAARIVATDLIADRLSQARDLGADLTFKAGPELPRKVLSSLQSGVHLAVETAGAPQALQQAVEILRPGGDLVLVGNQPLEKSLPLSLIERIMRKQLRLHGSFMSFSAPFPGMEWVLTRDALNAGELSPDQVVTERLSLEEGEYYFNRLGEDTPIPQKTVFLL
jgi:L-iditol 2-dehydrogenase